MEEGIQFVTNQYFHYNSSSTIKLEVDTYQLFAINSIAHYQMTSNFVSMYLDSPIAEAILLNSSAIKNCFEEAMSTFSGYSILVKLPNLRKVTQKINSLSGHFFTDKVLVTHLQPLSYFDCLITSYKSCSLF